MVAKQYARTAVLDVSTHEDNALGSNERRMALLSALKEYNKTATCLVTQAKFRQGLLNNLCYLYNVVMAAQSRAEVDERIENLLPEEILPVRLAWQNLTNFFGGEVLERLRRSGAYDKKMADEKYVLGHVAGFLRIAIRKSWESMERITDQIIDDIGCGISFSPPEFVDGRVDISGACLVSECGLQRYLLNCEPLYSRLLAGGQFGRVEGVMSQCKAMGDLGKPESQAGRTLPKCLACAEMLIVLQAPRNSDVVHRSSFEFEHACILRDGEVGVRKYTG